ncbi:hypothetical protein ACP0HM_25805 [Escherichia coli]
MVETFIWFFRSSSGYGRQHGGTSCGCTRSGTGEEKASRCSTTRKVIFNTAIKNAVAKGDVDKALKLLDEAERTGSTSARSTFISSVKGRGNYAPQC